LDLISENENLTEEQKKVFWDLIDIFDKQGLLPFVMLIGSWSEMIYDKYYIPDFSAHIRTRDVDFLYKSLYKPTGKNFDIVNILKEKGFSCETNRLTGINKFVMEDFFTIEFLIKVLGSGDKEHQEIPSLGIVGIGLRDINMLERYPLTLLCDKYTITVPEPEVYILQTQGDGSLVFFLAFWTVRDGTFYSRFRAAEHKRTVPLCPAKLLRSKLLGHWDSGGFLRFSLQYTQHMLHCK